MKSASIRAVVVLGVLSVVGIALVQLYWVRQAFDAEARQLDQTVGIALRDVAAQLARANAHPLPANPVQQLSASYFVVNVNQEIDPSLLGYYLRREFAGRNLDCAYEYAVYDRMVAGSYVPARAAGRAGPAPLGPAPDPLGAALPRVPQLTYYFGVRLPGRGAYLASQLSVWGLTSGIVVLVQVFFGYALFVILRQKQLSEMQRDFINSMTHEFKTPIATIALAADALGRAGMADQPQRLRSYAGIIGEESRRLDQQVNKVLQLAQAERDAPRGPHLEAVDLHALLDQVIRNYDLAGRHPAGTIATDLAPGRPLLYADPTHLANLLFNLLDNAVKHAGPVPARVQFSTRRLQGQRLAVAVRDHGPGIAAAHQRRVFEKFFRVPAPAGAPAVPGFGLGLAYVRRVVATHRHWRLALRSAPGEGCTFTLTVPLAPALPHAA